MFYLMIPNLLILPPPPSVAYLSFSLPLKIIKKSSQTQPRFAVRSSGCGEDGEETSAAGQNETQLGVVGVENLLRALAACWASLFTFQSVEYRRYFTLFPLPLSVCLSVWVRDVLFDCINFIYYFRRGSFYVPINILPHF